MSKLKDLISTITAISITDVRYEFENLIKVQEWALQQLNLDYVEGDKVVIKSNYIHPSKEKAPGWWSCRASLIPGALATVKRIGFNGYHRYWYADIVLDHEVWVRDDGSHGVVSVPHTFSFDAIELQKAPEALGG